MTHQKIHIGLIPDGNRRWCRKNGHDVFTLLEMMKNMCVKTYREQKKLGSKVFLEEYNHISQIKEISVYVLSKDNLTKRKDSTLQMIEQGLKIVLSEKEYYAEHIKIQFIGELSLLPDNILNLCKQIENETKDGELLLSVAIAYDPIIDSSKILTDESKRCLYKQSDIDMVIRTGCEKRSSGFFPLKTLYSEFFYLDNLFPDTTLYQINECIGLFNKRQRRFGE